MSTFAQLNPFASTIPEHIEQSLEANAVVAKFNKNGRFKGQFLAAGRLDGMVVLWDFSIRGPIQVLEGHVKPIVSLSWSRRGRFLLSASKDWTVIVWDLKTGERRRTVRFDAPVTCAALHSKNSKIMAVTLQNQAETKLFDWREGREGTWDLMMSHLSHGQGSIARSNQKKEVACIVRFAPKHNLCFVASSTGNVYTFDLSDPEKSCIHYEKVCGQTIKDMEFDPGGSSLVINGNDRAIRVYGLIFTASGANASDEQQPRVVYNLHHRFQDLISRNPWCHCNFSSDGEYVYAGTGSSQLANEIHIWDRSTGALVKILEGGKKDAIEGLDWHPSRPVIATVSDLGNIVLWSQPPIERWAAYAPGFEELQENLEYNEAEDEFDLVDPAILERRKQEEQDQFVDIIGEDNPDAMLLDDNGNETDEELKDWDDLKEDFVPTKGDNATLGYEDFIESGIDRSKSQSQSQEQSLEPGQANGTAKKGAGASIDAVLHVKNYEPPRQPSPATDERLLQEAIAKMDQEEGRLGRRRARAA